MQSANNTNMSQAAQDKQLLNLLQRLEYVTLEDIHKTMQKCRVMHFINKPTFRTCLQYFAVLDKISSYGCQSSTPQQESPHSNLFFFTSMYTKVTCLGIQVINIHLLGKLITETRCDKQR